MINYIYFTYIHKCIHNHNIKINRWFNDQLWSFYILGSLAWPLSTFSVNLPSLKCMTNILVSPSIRSLSLLFQVCWSTRYCMIRSISTTWLNNLVLISSLLESGCSLYSRSQALPVFHTSSYLGRSAVSLIDPSSHHPHP